MIFDAILLILVLIAFYRGWNKGILWAVFSLIATIIGILLSLKLAHQLSDYLFTHNIITSQYTLLFSFVILFIGVILLFRLGIKLVEKLLDKILLGWVNKILGGVLYSFIIVFLMSTLIWLFNQVNILGDDLKKDSKAYTFVEPIAPKTFEVVSKYIPMLKEIYQDIKIKTEKVL